MNHIQLGRYIHYKGNHYEVIGFAKHSETLEDMVVYKALYKEPDEQGQRAYETAHVSSAVECAGFAQRNFRGEHGTWVRPLSMWDNPIEVDGKTVKRFEFIGENGKSERQHDLQEALRSIESTIGKCEKAQTKLREGTPQYTLTKRRLEALYIARDLIERELEKPNE